MRQPPNSMSAVGPPMWVNRVSDMRRNLGASAGMVEIWDGLSLDRVRHAPRRVIARWPRVKYLRPGTSESTPQTGRAASLDATPERTELGNTEIFLVQTPTGELRLSSRRCRVGVLHFHQPIAPPIRERRRFQIDAVDAETVQFLECGELARDALDQVSKTRRLVVAVGDRQDVDLDSHGGVSWKLILAAGSEDCLRPDHDHLRSLDDLTSRPDGVFQLVATHQLAIWSTSIRSSCESSPPIGETSRISIESRSNPVKTRWSPGTSQRSISDIHRSRLRPCGSPLTPLRSRSRLCSMVGRHCS